MRFARMSAVASLSVVTLMPSDAHPGPGVEAAWTHIQDLAGTWRGHSSKGWDETIQVQLLAGGSVLLETSRFDDDPKGENAMATAYYKDGDRLLLTHYCEARNQPRLMASEFGDDGATVTFTFLDGGNLPSRDIGHMDSVVMRFADHDHFRSQWTWYAKGKATWLEDITYERAKN
jgi:hypothetical protein